MGLAWQQAPFGESPRGRFLVPEPLPEHILYAERAERRMRVELRGTVLAQSDDVVLLHETGRYPVAYFPRRDTDWPLLRRSTTRGTHPVLGDTEWWTINVDGEAIRDAAWSHPSPPPYASELAELVAFVWDAMDAFYEEDEPILGHAADPYHRVDVRASRRHVAVSLGGQRIADTRNALAVFETGFAPRWYLPPNDIVDGTLEPSDLSTFCPYKGGARYFDVVAPGTRVPNAAWTYPEALPESARLASYVSFDPEMVVVALDGERLLPAEHQNVTRAGTDRAL